MGSENLFHKRKAKNTKDLERKKEQRQTNKRILIVCEGTKTETRYFQDARDHYKLNTVTVEIKNKGTSDPVNMVQFSHKHFTEAENTGNPFDLVFCVFDRDVPSKYDDAVKQLKAKEPKNTFFAIGSVPCFEYWLLLHFTDSTSPFGNAKEVINALSKHMPEYQKNQKNLFKTLLTRLEQAKINATTALKTCASNQTINPSTYVHHLIEALEKLKQ